MNQMNESGLIVRSPADAEDDSGTNPNYYMSDILHLNQFSKSTDVLVSFVFFTLTFKESLIWISLTTLLSS